MTTASTTAVKAFGLVALGLALAAMGVHVAGADDAPGAAVLGALLMTAGVALSVRAARGRLPAWAARTGLALGVVVAAAAAFLIHRVTLTAPLFPAPQEVPSVTDSAPAPPYAAAIQSARALVRAAVVEQNLPGVSVAVGAGDAVVWAEGFGWRDVGSRAPVTPDTRFNIGTAASTVSDSVAPLGLTHSGAEPAADWSPGHLGEPEDDFPPFTLIRHVVFRPIGLAPDRPLPGNRATFYVPRSGDNPVRGRREMYMRDMVCCADRMTFYSTPTDLVRFALARNPGSVSGELAGGTVMSMTMGRGAGVAVAVTANIAHANTPSLALRLADAFAQRTP